MESLTLAIQPQMTDEFVEQMVTLAERLRTANGGELDESAINAVAEATGAPVEYVRLVVKLKLQKERKGLFSNLRAQFLTLGADTRRYVLSGIAACICALMISGGGALDRFAATSSGTAAADASSYGFCGMLGLLAIAGGAFNAAMSREIRTAAIAGAIFGGGYIFMVGIFSFLLAAPVTIGATSLPVFALVGAFLGAGAFRLLDQNRSRLGIKDPSKDRMELLRQLHDLQTELTAGKQDMTFMSVDVVGSTKMKERADPLTIEFTFSEYHLFVGRIAGKYGGRVHSTAGDGVICAFESPISSFGAARNIQAEILEFNMLRNKLPVPISVRVGIHRGSVVAPRAGDPTSINFAHVIDVAAHVEKACPPGGIAITEAAASSLIGGMNAIGQQRFESDGQTVVVWAPKSAKLSGIPET